MRKKARGDENLHPAAMKSVTPTTCQMFTGRWGGLQNLKHCQTHAELYVYSTYLCGKQLLGSYI